MFEGGELFAAAEAYARRLWEDIQSNTKKDFKGMVIHFHAAPQWSTPTPGRGIGMGEINWVMLCCCCPPYLGGLGGACMTLELVAVSAAHPVSAKNRSPPVPVVGGWLQRALSLVPLQLCRCEGNTLHAMSDGQPLQLDLDVTDINEVAGRISFGMYDLLLQSCCNMPVFVVSSMGSQSVGKSYQVGSGLGTSGSRGG